MNERRATILNLVAEAYIATAHPVPSSRIADSLDLSSATVRNEFAALEEEGFLVQPHTSAGRIPTAHGFTTYARGFLPPHRLPSDQLQRVRTVLTEAHGETLLRRIAALVAELSGYAVVVRLPAEDRLRTHEVHLSLLSGRHLLAVVVLENGLVRQFAVELDPTPPDDVIDDAERNLRQLTLPAQDVPPALRQIAANAAGELARTLLAVAEAWPSMTAPRLVADGLRNILAEPEARDPDFVRRVVEEAEEHSPPDDVSEPISLMLDDAVARVAARVDLFGRTGATVTLLGPARMRYPWVLTVVSSVRDAVSGGTESADVWGKA